MIVVFALMLVGLKLMVGALLLAALFAAVYEKYTFGSTDDAMLDVALFIAAVATIGSGLPGVIHGGELLLAVIGELMLCVIASALAIYGRGYLVKQELPRPTRPEPGMIRPLEVQAGITGTSRCKSYGPPAWITWRPLFTLASWRK